MKCNPRPGNDRAFTLLETLVSTAISVVLGAILFDSLWYGSVLFSKNTAINVAHQQARSAVMRIENDLHGAVSVPQLVDASRNPVTGFGPAAGIAFHSFSGGPYRIAAGDYLASQNQITIVGAGKAPAINQRLNIPSHHIESYITDVHPSGGNYQLTLAGNLPYEVNTTLSGQNVNITCFTTEQVTYVVQNQTLLKYSTRGSTSGLALCNDVTVQTPFSIPQTPTGAAYNRFVAAINLSCADKQSANLGFKSANMFLNSMVPFRSRLTLTQ
jgi:type II secretory pathway pseudopilin PulG